MKHNFSSPFLQKQSKNEVLKSLSPGKMTDKMKLSKETRERIKQLQEQMRVFIRNNNPDVPNQKMMNF